GLLGPVKNGLDPAHRLARDVPSGLERVLALEVRRAQDVPGVLLLPLGPQRADRVELLIAHMSNRAGESKTGRNEGNAHTITCFRPGLRVVVFAAQWARLAASTGVSSPSSVVATQRHAREEPTCFLSQTAIESSSAFCPSVARCVIVRSRTA